MSEAPLDGLKVLDLGQHIAAPYCAKLLATLGAEVIKIEPPAGGDPARRAGPFPDDLPHPEKSGLYLYLNTGKRGITLDLTSTTGKQIFKELVGWADVVVENFSPQVLPSLGLGYEVLEQVNPRVVLTSISNFGQTGPYRDSAAEEITLWALGGLMYQAGLPEYPPLKFGPPVVQYSGGLSAFTATMMAVTYADLTGIGQQVDVALLEVVASNHFQSIVEYTYTGSVHQRNRAMMILPALDGWVSAPALARHWVRFPDVIGMPELREDPRFATELARRQNADDLEAITIGWMADRTKEEIYRVGQSHHMPWSYVASVADLVNSPQYQARGFFAELDHPAAGKQLYPTLPMRIGDAPPVLGRAPLLGEHNPQVYGDLLGYSPADLVRLRERGVI
ncbi:MAG: CoA transferase [Chloroflexi bacterium]|nr:CoA transferase [Chloroflexota bacterium]